MNNTVSKKRWDSLHKYFHQYELYEYSEKASLYISCYYPLHVDIMTFFSHEICKGVKKLNGEKIFLSSFPIPKCLSLLKY